MARYISLYSGSSGNCSVIEDNGKFIIIDMGKSARLTNKAICDIGLDVKNLQGILVSHEHSDHVNGLKVFLKKLNVPVYSNTNTIDYLADYDLLPGHIQLEDMGDKGINIGPFFVRGFDTPHDSVGCMGFNIHTENGTRMTMATDLGCVTDNILNSFIGADLAVIESNYDEQMLKENQNYPYYLKKRIESNRGHLSNIQCSNAVSQLVKSGLRKIHLCHLSNNNNMPTLAINQVRAIAAQQDIDMEKNGIILMANHRHDITKATDF